MSFAVEVNLWSVHALEGLRGQRAAGILELCSTIIAETPIKTGLARGNWQSSLGSPKTDVIDRRPSIAAVEELAEIVGAMKEDETFYFTDCVPYATALEFGHSQQAPAGMVRKNIQRWPNVVYKAEPYVPKAKATAK